MFSFPMTFLSFLLAFCRVVIGLVFALSFLGKVRDIQAFEQAISRFKILPTKLGRFSAWLLLGFEFTVITTMLVGGRFLFWGFFLTALMLSAFCMALASVLIRKIHTSCNCFGATEKLVSSYDLVRNIGFILCALGGLGALATTRDNLAAMGVLDWGLVFTPGCATS